MTRIQQAAFVAIAALLILSVVHAPFPDQMYLQHIPTVLALIACPFLAKRFPISNPAFLCLATFALLHVIAARYIYSYVPYDKWSQSLFGFSITETFAFHRNHFDRLVHFSFGLLFIRPIWEICVRYLGVQRRFAYYTAFEFVLATSMLYELFEWGLTVVLAGPDADAYNGQQGDIWDSQKDMACALVGALTSLVILYFTRGRRKAAT